MVTNATKKPNYTNLATNDQTVLVETEKKTTKRKPKREDN